MTSGKAFKAIMQNYIMSYMTYYNPEYGKHVMRSKAAVQSKVVLLKR